MFAKNIVGTANALVAGWGGLGSCLAQRFMGDFLLPKLLEVNSGDAEKAWRTACIIPAVFAFISGTIIYFISDDLPRGNYAELKKHGVLGLPSLVSYAQMAVVKHNSWLLFLQFACCNGAGITMNNAAALYLKDEFGLYTEDAAKVSSSMCYMHLFAGILGGFISDAANRKIGMRGRLIAQSTFLLAEGIMILLLSRTSSLMTAKVVIVVFQLFSLAAQASTFAIAPYVCIPATGFVMGLVGAGGNLGAYSFGQLFRNLQYDDAFNIMGAIVILSSGLSALIYIQGHSALFCGKEGSKDEPEDELEEIVA